MSEKQMDQERAEIFSAFIDEMNAGALRSLKEFATENGVLAYSMLPLMEAVMPFCSGSLFGQVSPEYRETTFARLMWDLTHRESTKEDTVKSVPITQRTDILILMMHFMEEQWGHLWGNVKLMKLPFLLAQEGGCGSFVPDFYFPSLAEAAYDYGAFDQNVFDDVDGLVAMGIIKKRLPPSRKKRSDGELGIPTAKRVDWIYELSPKGERIAEMLLRGAMAQNPEIARKIQEVVRNHGNKTMDQLLDYTYNKYPDSAKKSKVKDKYLRGKSPKQSPSHGDSNE